MASAIPGFTPTLPPSDPAKKSGLNGMGASEFLNLMINQLQQQDPLNPTDSNQLLTQMSQISNLQSNQAMQTSLEGLTLQQSIGAGGNLIGKSVQGIDSTGNAVQGIVTSVKVEDKAVYLEMDSGRELPMANVTKIAATSPASSAALASLLQSSSGTNNSSSSAALMNLLTALGAR